MRINRDDIEPHVYEKLTARIAASTRNPNPSSHELLAREMRDRHIKADIDGVLKRDNKLVVRLIAAGVVGAIVLWMFVHTIAAIGLMVVLGLIVFVYSFWGIAVTLDMHSRASDTVRSDALTAWLPIIDLTRSERTYCETVVLLAETGAHLDDATRGDVLNRLNTLMAHIRRLDEQSTSLRPMASQSALDALTAESNALAARAAGAVEKDAREALHKSAAMCHERLEHAHRVAPSLAKLELQQEVLFQALASVQASLARSKAAAATLSTTDVDEISQRITEITGNAEAVELAVQEVMAAVAQR